MKHANTPIALAMFWEMLGSFLILPAILKLFEKFLSGFDFSAAKPQMRIFRRQRQDLT